MRLVHFVWLLYFINSVSAGFLEAYQYYEEVNMELTNKEDQKLPIRLRLDKQSGCVCRATTTMDDIICFGSYGCEKFPKVPITSNSLKVRTTVIVKIKKGELDYLNYVRVLEIESNHQLRTLEAGIFRNLSNLQQLSISYNSRLNTIPPKLFQGLTSLRNLTLVHNGFTNILHITLACRPNILPSLRGLDLSQNSFEKIPENAFDLMKSTLLKRLEIHLARLDYIHPRSFLPLTNLKELHIGENDLNSSLIGSFLFEMMQSGINLTYLDLSGMGFRKQVPMDLLGIISKTTIKILVLAQNLFEIIDDHSFPRMPNIEVLDLRKVMCLTVESRAFDPCKFPKLRVLILAGNNLPGIHTKHLSSQLYVLNISNNKGPFLNALNFEIDSDIFMLSRELRVLNLSYNGIKSIFNYTFRGLDKLRVLNLENGTIYQIGPGTFKHMKKLLLLNLGNNPLSIQQNMTSSQYEGLNELKWLILKNCGIKHLYEEDNIFEMMPNLTHLVLRNNQLYYLTAETIKPLKFLEVLDLSDNLFITWWNPLFLAAGISPKQLFLTNNKISHFSTGMMQDINYLLEINGQNSTEIDFMNNVFICDCHAMYTTYIWLQENGTMLLNDYFSYSKFQCSTPDLWEDRRVAEFLSSVKHLNCIAYDKLSKIIILAWTAPSLITVIIVALVLALCYKYRIYIRYWLFIAKIALGRRFFKRSGKLENLEERRYRYDAFVSYCNEDRDFVLNLIKELEMKPPFLKLCVYERDFEIGAFISESILNSISESKFIVLIISNNFAKSHWCRWETQLAEYHRLFIEDGSVHDPLMLVKLGEVENKYLTTTLKYLLKAKIYLAWDGQHSDEFWKKLRNVLAKRV